MKLRNIFLAEIKRTLLIMFSYKATFLNSFVFFILSIFALHLGIGTGELSQATSFGILASYLVFAIVLTTNVLFEEDYKNGITDEQIILPAPFEVIIIAKYISYCITLITISILASPVAAILLNITTDNIPLLVAVIILIVLNQTSICLLATSLTLGVNTTSLISLLILPLSLPVIICANLIVSKPSILFLLSGMFIFILPLTVLLTKLAVKHIR